MKFQNPSMHGSEVMLCIKKRNGRTDTRMDGRTHAQTSQKQYAPPTSSKMGHYKIDINLLITQFVLRFFFILFRIVANRRPGKYKTSLVS